MTHIVTLAQKTILIVILIVESIYKRLIVYFMSFTDVLIS